MAYTQENPFNSTGADCGCSSPLQKKGKSEIEKGTQLTFYPSLKTFSKIEFDFNILERRLRELGFLNSNIKISLIDKRKDPVNEKSFFYSVVGL